MTISLRQYENITNACLCVAIGSVLLIDAAGKWQMLLLATGMVAALVSVCTYFTYHWNKDEEIKNE